MPRKTKTAEDYASENKEFNVGEVDGNKFLICKYCRVTVPIVTGKTASRISEHIASKTHLKNSAPSTSEGGTCQLSFVETLTRFKRKREVQADVAHEFAWALIQSGTSLLQADGPIGKLFRRRAPAATTLPKSTQMYEKYLPEVFHSDTAHIRDLLDGVIKISLTIDETPEMHGDPAVAVLFTFCDSGNDWARRTVMADIEVMDTCNAVSIAALLQRVLDNYGKDWHDVVSICSDSASYMQKLCDDLSKGIPTFKAFPVRDPCHLLDGVLKAALKSSQLLTGVVDFVVHSGALFRYARELKRKFFSVCSSQGIKAKVIPSVSFSRWFSVLEAVNTIIAMWRPFTEFILSDDATGKKCDDLRGHIDTEIKKNTVFCVLKFLQENMTGVVNIIKKLEAESMLIYDVYSVIGVDVKKLFEDKLGDNVCDFGPATSALLECLPLGKQRHVEEMFCTFYSTMHDKWQAMLRRNIPTERMAFEMSEASLWYAAQVIDPLRKAELSPDYGQYEYIFTCFGDSEAIVPQFNEYVAEAPPDKQHINVHAYWLEKLQVWPELSKVILNLLALPVSSANVERAFSQIKVFTGRKERSRMSKEALKKYCLIYYNKFDL